MKSYASYYVRHMGKVTVSYLEINWQSVGEKNTTELLKLRFEKIKSVPRCVFE